MIAAAPTNAKTTAATRGGTVKHVLNLEFYRQIARSALFSKRGRRPEPSNTSGNRVEFPSFGQYPGPRRSKWEMSADRRTGHDGAL